MALATIFQRALAARITVTEHGRRTQKSKLEITLTQLINKAAGGDLKATGLLLHLFPLLDPASATALGLPDLAADRALAERYFARLAEAALSDTPPRAEPENSHAAD
jgi:AraC-like DNA-binding protein